ncbi:MAG: 50S ribosomal protein L24 [Bacilli bacterium]|nr:50S ribosomal protein L24 [Bacilli bacterium]
MNLKKGDTVVVISGSWKNKQGTVLQVLQKSNRVVVEGVNIVTHHNRPSQSNPDGGISKKEAPIAACKVMIVDPQDKVPTRVGYKMEGDKKVRYAKKSGVVLDK